MSILDGWWPEAFDGTNGWAIGSEEDYHDHDYQDQLEAQEIYELLEEKVIPTFFDRGPDGLPHKWIEMMKNSMAKVSGFFNSHRMIEQYMEEYYVQAGFAHQILGENRQARAIELRDWKHRMKSLWRDVRVLDVSLPKGDRVSLGDTIEVRADINLGPIRNEEIVVDLCYGVVGSGLQSEKMVSRNITAMMTDGTGQDGVWRFKANVECEETGVYAYKVRVTPFHPYLFNPLSMGLVTWG